MAMKSTLKITSKGQITLRKAVLDELGVRPGDCVTVETTAPGRLELRSAERTGTIDDFIGCAARPDGPVLSIEEMNEIIRDGWAGRR
jgi:AbrB family looped-hinge helix DNA binding protein